MRGRFDWKAVLLNDWQHRLTAFFTGLLLLQFVNWIAEENGFWLPLTVKLVKMTLLIVFLLELPVWRPAFRRMMQFVLLLVYTGFTVGYLPVMGKDLHFYEMWLRNVIQFFPWFWFVGSAFLIYAVTLRLVQVRSRIYMLILVSIFALAMRDSFSRVYLWDEAAVVLLAGLSLLVIRRLSELKRKNPEGWSHIAEYPISFAAPIVMLLAVTLIFATSVPDVRNLLTDPYTLYKRWQNQPVLLGGKVLDGPVGDLFNASSGYSRSDESLGGNFEFDFSQVMTVQSTQKTYWRGETRSIYNGKGWEKSPIERQTRLTNALTPETVLPLDSRIGQMKTIEVKQTVTMENDESYPVLFGAYNISRVETVDSKNTGFDRVQWAARSSELRWDEGRSRAGYPKTYTLVSQVPVLDKAALRSAPVELPNKQAMADYLQLPAGLPDRVKGLALDLTRNAGNPYDKAKAIETYLRENYKYSNKPNTTGESKDFADRFLFESREGYCDYFSTAMAVLSRASGIPARWVKGYAPGSGASDIPAEIRNFVPNVEKAQGELDTYTVRNADAHSWVELYFAGLGWYPFEATAGFNAADVLPTPDAAAPPVSDTPVLPDTEIAQTTGASTFPVRPVAIGSIAALAATAAVLLLLKRRKGTRKDSGGRRKAAELNMRIVSEYNKLLKASKRKGLPVYAHETARETISRWKRKERGFNDDLDQMLHLFEKAKYSPLTVTHEEYERAAGIVKKLRKAL